MQRVEQNARARDGEHGQRAERMGQRDQRQNGPAGHPAPAYYAERRPAGRGAVVVIRLLVVLRVVDLVIDLVVDVVVAGVGFQRLALVRRRVELARAGVRDPIGVSLLLLSRFLAMAHPFRTDAPSRRKAGQRLRLERRREVRARLLERRVEEGEGFTLPRAAVTESATPGWRARSVVRNARSRRARSACPSTRSRPSPGRARGCRRRSGPRSRTPAAGRGAACPCARRPRAAARRSAR